MALQRFVLHYQNNSSHPLPYVDYINLLSAPLHSGSEPAVLILIQCMESQKVNWNIDIEDDKVCVCVCVCVCCFSRFQSRWCGKIPQDFTKNEIAQFYKDMGPHRRALCMHLKWIFEVKKEKSDSDKFLVCHPFLHPHSSLLASWLPEHVILMSFGLSTAKTKL